MVPHLEERVILVEGTLLGQFTQLFKLLMVLQSVVVLTILVQGRHSIAHLQLIFLMMIIHVVRDRLSLNNHASREVNLNV